MYLKEVHMENFKSFGRKLTVPFEDGYSGITGPNGSGKSNIGDAILFVLGPNSPRAIRAGRLTDLIFNGGSTGKAANHTIVSLTFDNRKREMPVDADEVTLTRKVKRMPKKDDPDGYSSYFYVNGRASKKKEFVDLLNHARISADGYNITQQGDVLEICKMTPVGRRQILDDIAGVTTFDKDIDQADKRKAEVEDNLERISIVLEEIENHLRQLEREKDAATKWKALQEEAKQTKGLMAWRRRTDLESQIAGVQQQIEKFTEERGKYEGQLAELKGRYKESQARFAEKEQKMREEGGEEVEKLQNDIQEARDRMVRFEEKIAFAKTELQDADESDMPLRDELRRVQKEMDKTAKIEQECAAQHAQVTQDLAAKKQAFEDVEQLIVQSDSGALELKAEMGRLKKEHEDKQLELHETRLEADRTQEKVETARRRLADLQSELEAVTNDLKEAEWELGEIQQTTDSSGKKRKEAERRLFELRKAQAEFTQQKDDLENRIRRLQREHAEMQAQHDAAARASGGAGRAVEAIMAARDAGRIKGIVGTIAELANAEPDYQTALETAAGANMQAIVVEDDATAQQCIELLKSERAGRAKLLPLNKMVPGRPRGQALMKVKKDGSLGFCLDLIDFNPRYHGAFWNVFGDTFVVQDMRSGRSLMGGVRMVGLDGELFEAGGAMISGAMNKKKGGGFANTDRSRLDELLHQIAEAEAAQERAIEDLARVRQETEALAEQVQAMGDGGGEARLKDLEARTVRLKERHGRLTVDAEAVAKEVAALDEAHDGMLTRIQELEARLEEMEAIREQKGSLLLKGGRKDLREKAEALQKEIRALTEAMLQAENRRDVAAKQLELVRGRVKELEESLDGRGRGRERHQDDIKRYSEALEKANAEVDALMKMERKATSGLKDLRDKKDKAYKDLIDLKSKMDKIADRMETQFALITNAKSKLPALEESLGEAMVEMDEHPVEVTEDMEVPAYDELRKQVRLIEQKIERLGAVNMRALEEFEAQSERQTTLKEEVARLEDQRAELVKLVSEIQEKKKAALTEVFEAINANFSEVYARLSMGGEAYMKLENAEDPFAGGLILMAQPMGKRVTRLDALSGGEKSLTSMAFIFAIQMYEPSPFYYLDEVDQNLDAVNSELLAKLVKDNARFAQFIQVSLRKITLKEASFLYGVTQSVPGQSEVIANFDLDRLDDVDDAETEVEVLTDGSTATRESSSAESGLQETIKRMTDFEVKP